MKKGISSWCKFVFRTGLAAAVCIVFFLLCFQMLTFQTSVEREQKISPDQIEQVELVIPKRDKIEQFQGQQRKVAYLTFDDGPSEYTNDLLDVLKEENIPATFFLIGNSIKKNDKAILERMASEGHYLGAHSMTHNYQLLYKKNTYISEMLEVQKLIEDVTGLKNNLVRSPYGSHPGMIKKIRDEAAKENLKTWDWTVDSTDWRLKGKPTAIVESIKRQVHNDVEVILLHDRETTIQALPEIISYLRSKNYTFKVYDEDEHFMVNFWNDNRL